MKSVSREQLDELRTLIEQGDRVSAMEILDDWRDGAAEEEDFRSNEQEARDALDYYFSVLRGIAKGATEEISEYDPQEVWWSPSRGLLVQAQDLIAAINMLEEVLNKVRADA